MLVTRQIIPSSVAHIVCPLLLEDGSTVVLAAVASSLHVRLPVWEVNDVGKMCCTFLTAVDELQLGTVATSVVSCAHQCFVVLTQDNTIVVGRYQTNLPAPRGSWLANDALHHNNAWIILYRGKFSTISPGNRSIPIERPLLACGARGTIVHCVIVRGRRHTISIDIPESAPDAFFREKWVFDIPQSMGMYSFGVAPFRRDVVEQSDEDMLMHCTVTELAERKRLQRPPEAALPCGNSPVGVSVVTSILDNLFLSLALMPVTSHQRKDNFVFVSAICPSINVYEAFHTSFSGDARTTLCVSGSPYFVLTIPCRVLVFSRVVNMHMLSVFGISAAPLINMADVVSNFGMMRLARSSRHPLAGVVLQRRGVGEILWLLLENGLLTEVPIGGFHSCDSVPVVCDAPNIQSGDCEDGEWLISCISGLPPNFCGVSLIPFQYERSHFQPYALTERYALLSNAMSDTYVVDLVERRVVGGLLSHGAMTCACSGPGMDIIVSYTNGMLQRLSPGLDSPMRVCAAFAGVNQMFPLPHMDTIQSTVLTFHFLVTTTTRTAIMRGKMGHFEELHKADIFVLDEPTLALYSAASAAPTVEKEEVNNKESAVIATSSPASSALLTLSLLMKPSFSFIQCTPTCINVSGARTALKDLIPGFDEATHACFSWDDGKLLAIADGRHVGIFSITWNGSLQLMLLESLPGDVSHLAAWAMNGSCKQKKKWAVAACLWSYEIVVWHLECASEAALRYVVPINSIVFSSFPLGRCREESGENVCSGGVGLVLMDRTSMALHFSTEGEPPVIAAFEDVDGRVFLADCCLPVTVLGGVVADHHFNLLAVRGANIELLLTASTGALEEQLSVALSSNSGIPGDDCSGVFLPRSGFLLYSPAASIYLMLLSDGANIALWSFPELLPPPATNAMVARRRGALQRGSVVYKVMHALQLPSVSNHDHSLTKAVYLPFTNTIIALTDRGDDVSIVNTIDAETFRVIDGLPMTVREIPTCVEILHADGADLVVIGTALLSFGNVGNPMAGRLLVTHARPLRVSAAVCIVTGGAVDVSVQGRGDEHLIAVASLDNVLVYRLAGFSLSLVCCSPTKSPCTTVALRYPFISCGLQSWGTQYMQLLPEGGDTDSALERDFFSTASEEYELDNTEMYNVSMGTECVTPRRGEKNPWPRWRGVSFSLKPCALEPTAFADVHSQVIYGDKVARVDSGGNIIIVAFKSPSQPLTDNMTATRVVGVEGGYNSVLTHCLRLPSCPLRIQVSEGVQVPWRHRKTPFVSWCEHSSALRLVGPTLLLPCTDGSLHSIGVIPHAFASPLLRLEQRITELYDVTLSVSRLNLAREGGGGKMRRTYHSISFESESAMQTATRLLRKQSFLRAEAIEEYFMLSFLSEMPDPSLTAQDRALVDGKKRLLDEHLAHIWEEYGGELQDVDIADLLHLW